MFPDRKGKIGRISNLEDPVLDISLFEIIIHRYPKWLPLAYPTCHGTMSAPTDANGKKKSALVHKQTLHNESILKKFVESWSTNKGTKNNATKRRDF